MSDQKNTSPKSTPIYLVDASGENLLPQTASARMTQWVAATNFKAGKGELCLVPDEKGEIESVLFGLGNSDKEPLDAFLLGLLPAKLPQGRYYIADSSALSEKERSLAVLAWYLGAYTFDLYTEKSKSKAELDWPEEIDKADLERQIEAVTLVRNLINTPSNDMGPDEVEQAIRTLAKTHGADVDVTQGEDLLAKNLGLIHAVGKGSLRAPRLIDMVWGKEDAPKITLVGKGVCFDTGGLDIKSASSMLLMKKDMGGAANVLGLAAMIMGAKLPIRLRVLIPAVENSVSGDAYRPSDIIKSHKGLTVEIGNTDAEGRLVLADALSLADEEEPDLLIDMATLTGAARVALGPDLPPFYSQDVDFVHAVAMAGKKEKDPVWNMPLWAPYDDYLSSDIADVNNTATGGYAGSITAALFLQRFVEKAKCWAHFDIYGWTPKPLPARPKGGEAQAIRALYAYISNKYGA